MVTKMLKIKSDITKKNEVVKDATYLFDAQCHTIVPSFPMHHQNYITDRADRLMSIFS